VGPRAGVNGCGKSRPQRDSIPDLPACSSVAIPTELPGPLASKTRVIKSRKMRWAGHVACMVEKKFV